MFSEGFWTTFKDNALFLLVCILVFAAIFAIAKFAEKLIAKGQEVQPAVSKNRYVVLVGMLSAVAFLLMLAEFPLPFAPEFYKLDFSEVPAMVGSFALGPTAGVLIEFFKILLKLVFRGTTTAFVGDFANFAVGCTFILPAGIIYHIKKTRKTAVLSMSVGTVIMTVFGSSFNAFYLIPKFSEIFGMPLDAIVAMGHAINGSINSVGTLVVFAVAPFNLLKGVLVTLITVLIYKRISIVLKGRH